MLHGCIAPTTGRIMPFSVTGSKPSLCCNWYAEDIAADSLPNDQQEEPEVWVDSMIALHVNLGL